MRRAAEAAAVFSVFLAYTHLFRDTFIDDAFISLKYSDMLAAGEGWTFLPGRMSNTATSPLNVIVHAAIGMLIGSMPYAIVVATALELAADRRLARARDALDEEVQPTHALDRSQPGAAGSRGFRPLEVGGRPQAS